MDKKALRREIREKKRAMSVEEIQAITVENGKRLYRMD